MTITGQVLYTYAGVLRNIRPLSQAAIFWFFAAAITGFLATHLMPAPGVNDAGRAVLAFILSAMNAYAILIGWYCVHRYFITGNIPATRLPIGLRKDMKAFEFVLGQVRNVILLSIISLAFLGPVTVYYAMHSLEMTPEEVMKTQQDITRMAVPIILVFFARLLLVAPSAARGELQSVARSWRATKGHFIRLNLLQFACIAPAAVATGLGALLLPYGLQAVSSLIVTAGAFFSLMLYARLAEDEYAKLIT